MAKRADRIESLAILLAKEGLNQPEDTIKSPTGLRSFALNDAAGVLGTLHVERRSASPPRWADFFAAQLDRTELGSVSSSAAVFHVPVDGRVMLLTFGQGRHLLKPGCWEEKFGIRTALNSIGVENLRSIDKHTLDTYGMHSRVQVSREAPPSEFDIDFERDLVRAITGTPSDNNVAQRLSGFDSLKMSKRTNLNTLKADLSLLLLQFAKEIYKDKFPWIDYVSEVRDPSLRDTLDLHLIDAIKEEKVETCWLAIPESVDWTDISGFRFRGQGTRPDHQDVRLPDFITDNNLDLAQLSVEYLRSHAVSAVTDEGFFTYTWPIYKCLYCEVEEAGETYLLTAGHWYKVATDFVQEVNESFQNVDRVDLNLPEYDDDTEENYNRRVAAADPQRLTFMDRKVVLFGGGASRIEFCDLLSSDRDIIHVKRYSGSSVLSHLFNQGSAAAELYASDASFRQLINEHLPGGLKLGNVAQRPNTSDYRIVYAIISSEKGDGLTLPFFSRLSLRQAVRRLRGYGYRVCITKIDVAASRLVLKRYAKKRKKP
jgi:uncharacterized protein (TIGR04141 family)